MHDAPYIDPTAPRTVAVGAVASCTFTFWTSFAAFTLTFVALTGALVAGTVGALRQPSVPPAALAASAAFNSGIAGSTFFSIREYFVSPLLAASRAGEQPSTTDIPHSLSDIRTYKLLDTTLAGGITGSVLYSWKRV
jgi:hypothetical protein